MCQIDPTCYVAVTGATDGGLADIDQSRPAHCLDNSALPAIAINRHPRAQRRQIRPVRARLPAEGARSIRSLESPAGGPSTGCWAPNGTGPSALRGRPAARCRCTRRCRIGMQDNNQRSSAQPLQTKQTSHRLPSHIRTVWSVYLRSVHLPARSSNHAAPSCSDTSIRLRCGWPSRWAYHTPGFSLYSSEWPQPSVRCPERGWRRFGRR